MQRIYQCMLTLALVLPVTSAYSQQTTINEYYWGTSLQKVFEDFQEKYNIKVEYDPTLVKDYKLDQLFSNTPVNTAFDLICRKLTSFTYYVDSAGVIHFESANRTTAIPSAKMANNAYHGSAQQHNITISGTVKDKATGETLPFATVQVKGTTHGTTTNIDGYFTLFKVASDTVPIEISYIGYQPLLFYLSPTNVKAPLIIELSPTVNQLSEVQIVARREEEGMKASEGISMVKMTPQQVADLPSLGEKDIFRSFQLLPGISGSNESSAGLYVRGGTPDQNLILYDGFTVYHQEHLFGMYSAFNTNAIKDVQLYKGGFESKYGGRLSSVMEITGKTGNEKEFNLGGDISLLSYNAFTEIPLGGKGSVFIAGRKSYKGALYNKFFDAFNEDNSSNDIAQRSGKGGSGGRAREASEPTSFFYDLNGKVTYRPTEKDIVSLSFFNGQDDLDNSRTFDRSFGDVSISGGVTDLTKWGNWGSSLKWSRRWNEKLYTNSQLSYSNYYSIRDRSIEANVSINGENTSRNRGTMEDNDLKDFTYKVDSEYKTGKNNQVEFGAQLTNYNIDYDFTQNDTTEILSLHDSGNLMSVYLQNRWTPGGKLTILPGIRTSYFTVTEQLYHAPRLQVDYQLTNKVKLKTAWGQYYQFANRVVREDILAGSRDFWVLSDGNEVPVGEAMHYIAGASYETQNFLFDVEAYYKDLKGLSEYTLRFTPSFGEIDYSSLFYEGTGYARGVEVLAQKKFGKLTGWIGYTWGQVHHNFPVYGEGYFAASHDVTHETKLVATYKANKHWTFSGTWIYATGKPYTEPLGGYTLTLLDGTTADYIVTGAKNGSRYPDYHRMDLSAKYGFNMGKGKGSLSFSLFNVYNRTNIWYKEFEIDETGLTETDVNLLGITPNITLSLKLK